MSAYGRHECLWIFMGVYGYLWVSMSTHRCLWISGRLWVFMGIYGCLWFYGCLWVFMGVWVFMGLYGCLWVFISTYRCRGFLWLFIDFWVSIGIIFKHNKYCLFTHSRTPEDLRTPENVWNHTCVMKNSVCTTGKRDFIDSCVFRTRQ